LHKFARLEISAENFYNPAKITE